MAKNRFIISVNPANNRVIGKVKVSSDNEIFAKVQEARDAFKYWSTMQPVERSVILRKLLQEIQNNKELISKSSTEEMGMPITQSRQDVDSALEFFNWYLNNAEKYLSSEISYEDETSVHKVFWNPTGVVAVITPWNFPLSNFIWGVVQNLVVGNTVVFKHSEEVPLFGKLIEKIVKKSRIPNGVFNEIYGDGKEGSFLARQNIDMIWFTGSSDTGKQLYRLGAEKFIKVLLELGGSAPGIVFEDAKIENVIDSVYNNRFTNAGQVCDGLKRLIVHESRFDELVERLTKTLETKKVGSPEDNRTDIGPLVSKNQLDLLKSQLADALAKGAKIIMGGKSPAGLKGAYFQPTLITNIKTNMKVWGDEVFGPLLPILTFKTEAEAIELANDTRYGLGSYIFSQDNNRLLRVAARIDAGMVSTNNSSYLNPSSPFGGYKESGLGRAHGKYGLRDLTKIKVVSFEKHTSFRSKILGKLKYK